MSDDRRPVVIALEFWPVPGRRAELAAAVQRGVRRAALAPGCLLFSLLDGEEGQLVLIEKWASQEQLSAWLHGPVVAELLESYAGLLARPPVPHVMRPRST